MKHVLLIDNDETMRETIAEILNEEHLKIINAKDKLDGIKTVCTSRVDLVITSVSETDGVVLTQTIKKIIPDLPIITIVNGSIISSRPNNKNHNTFVIKSFPLNIDNLLNEVHSILETKATIT